MVGHPGITKRWETLSDWSCKSGYWKMENWKMSFENELFSFINNFFHAKSLMISLTNSVKGKFINVCPGAWSSKGQLRGVPTMWNYPKLP